MENQQIIIKNESDVIIKDDIIKNDVINEKINDESDIIIKDEGIEQNNNNQQFDQKQQKEQQQKIDEDKEKKRQQKKNKRDKKKRKKEQDKRDKDSDREISDGELKRRKQDSKIWKNPSIPENLKQQYVDSEFNPLQVCVGNIPHNIHQDELKEYFQTILVSLKPTLATRPPIRNIIIGETKNFAIVTLLDRESRKLFLKCESLEYQGYKIEIRKTKNFFDKIYDKNKAIDPFGNIQTGIEDIDNQLYMGNLPTYLKDHEVKKICQSFGLLKFFKLMTQKNHDGEWVSKGYCFFEYQDPKIADIAVEGLKNLEIGKNKVKVSRAQAESAMNNIADLKPKEASNMISGSFLASYPGILNPIIQKMLDIPLCAITPSRVIQLLNMATADDLVEDEFYDILKKDVVNECSKYGTILQVEIPRPDLDTGLLGPCVGKIFVKFEFLIPAKKCRHYINGRVYNKKTVVASFYNEERFNLKEYLLKL